MTEFEQFIAEHLTDGELIDIIRDAVAGATQDVLSAMPADAWR